MTYDAPRRQFESETTEHVLKIIRDDGLYRHLRVQKPGTRMWSWDIVTWPGYLTIVGDIGDGYTFCREDDMFAWFGYSREDINPSYWRQKIQGPARESTKAFSETELKSMMADAITEHFEDTDDAGAAACALALAALREADEFSPHNYLDEARDFAAEHGLGSLFDEVWDWNPTDYDHHFLLACFAIQDAIRRYGAAKTITKEHAA